MRKFRFHVKKRVDEIVTKFMNAARNGDLKMVQLMVENDEIGVNAMDKSTGETALLAALVTGHTQVATYLLREGAYMFGESCVNGERLTALVTAVRTGDAYLVRRVAHAGLSLPRSYVLLCPFIEAAKVGSMEMAETVLGLGIHFTIHVLRGIPVFLRPTQASSEADKDVWLLLCVACWLRDKHLFDYLLRTRAEILKLDFHLKNLAVLLVFAVYQEETALVLKLLRN